jgi:NTP pyrophosphatase (non-canonical NTP hydrolase)
MEKMIREAHEMARDKGFWDDPRNRPELLMLIVSELAEALEALRKDHFANEKVSESLLNDLLMDEVDEEFFLLGGAWKDGFEKYIKSSFEDEIADVAIRLFDLCGGLNVDLEKHIKLKMKYNSMRGYKHGKKF